MMTLILHAASSIMHSLVPSVYVYNPQTVDTRFAMTANQDAIYVL